MDKHCVAPERETTSEYNKINNNNKTDTHKKTLHKIEII